MARKLRRKQEHPYLDAMAHDAAFVLILIAFIAIAGIVVGALLPT